MESESAEQQQKQDRHRTRWTASLDKIFADLVVEQIQLGNRPNNIFDKKSWNHIRDEFNRQTNLNFNNNQLRKHLDVLRTRYHNLRSTFDQHDAVEDSCYIGFDLWEDIAAQTRPETSKMKECPIYEQLCTIFADSSADGKYAQSSHYEELDKPGVTDSPCPGSGNPRPKTPYSSKYLQGNGSSQQIMSKIIAERKRKRSLETDSATGQSSRAHDIGDAMAKAMMEMLASSRLRASMPQTNEKFTITNCIKALDEIEGIHESLYFAALDLFEDANLREMFLSLRSNQIRRTWLQGKCPTALLI